MATSASNDNAFIADGKKLKSINQGYNKTKGNETTGKHDKYLGKRKYRGLFVVKEGKLINADGNGSLNIVRLGLNVIGDVI